MPRRPPKNPSGSAIFGVVLPGKARVGDCVLCWGGKEVGVVEEIGTSYDLREPPEPELCRVRLESGTVVYLYRGELKRFRRR